MKFIPSSVFTISILRKAMLPIAGMVLVTLSGCQTTQPSRFDSADKNKDGRLSRAEIGDMTVTEVFTPRDTNKDGKITMDEWTGVKDSKETDGFKKRDTNKDGAVTLEEARSYSRKNGAAADILKAADTNKDGYVDKAEGQAYMGQAEGSPR